MSEYFFIFFLLLILSAGFYYFYDRYFSSKKKAESELYVEALKDLLDNKQESAFTKLRQVVAEDSTNLDAYLLLGKILRDHKKPQQALQVHKDMTLRTDLNAEDKTKVLKELFYDYSALDDFDQAIAALKEMTTIRPKDRWALVNLLDMQRQAQRWDEAYETAVLLLKVEQNKSKKPLALFKYHQGLELYKKREYHKARLLFKEALGFDPKYSDAYLRIGDSYIEENRVEDAVNFWNKLISSVPEKGDLVIERLQKALFELGRFGEITNICENILAHSPKNKTARYCLAAFYEKKGDSDLAEDILNSLIDDNPEDTKSIVELIRIYLEKGENKKIETLVKDVDQRLLKRNRITPPRVADTEIAGT